MLGIFLGLIIKAQQNYIIQETWDGDDVMYYRSKDVNISIGKYVGHVNDDERSVDSDLSGYKNKKINIGIDRFEILDSNNIVAGSTLLAVQVTGPRWKMRKFKPGLTYLLITCPQRDGKLVDLAGSDSLRYPDKRLPLVQKTISAGSDQEQVCKLAYPTPAKRLHLMGNPTETLAMSLFDGLHTDSDEDFLEAYYNLMSAGDPEPTYHYGPDYPGIKPVFAFENPQPDNPVTMAMRAEAENKATPIRFRLAVYMILNHWCVAKTWDLLGKALFDATGDSNSCPQRINEPFYSRVDINNQVPTGETQKERKDKHAKMLANAKNRNLIIYWLQHESWLNTVEYNKPLLHWLDDDDPEVRRAMVNHLSEAFKRPDLRENELIEDGPAVLPDLNAKAQAWKEYFQTHSS